MEWIKTTEQLPEDKQRVIIFLGGNELRSSTYYLIDQFDRYNMFSADGYHKADCVTHWVPMPEPPKN